MFLDTSLAVSVDKIFWDIFESIILGAITLTLKLSFAYVAAADPVSYTHLTLPTSVTV